MTQKQIDALSTWVKNVDKTIHQISKVLGTIQGELANLRGRVNDLEHEATGKLK